VRVTFSRRLFSAGATEAGLQATGNERRAPPPHPSRWNNRDAAGSLIVMLKFEEHEVHAVFGAEEALACALRCRPKVVFLDIGLPGMDGYQVVRQLRAHEDLQATCIVALTEYGQPEGRKRSQETCSSLQAFRCAGQKVIAWHDRLFQVRQAAMAPTAVTYQPGRSHCLSMAIALMLS
jgi:CheY-like chemotaxis protein